MDGEQYQKCRYMAFQPALSVEGNPYIKQFLEKEVRTLTNVFQQHLHANNTPFTKAFIFLLVCIYFSSENFAA